MMLAMSSPQRIVRLREGLAARRGVLFIGPDFAHGVAELDLEGHVEALGAELVDQAGWDGLSLDDRLTLAAQGLGDDGLGRALGDRLPSVEVLRGRVRAFHRRLLALPFPTVVDCAVDDLVEAAMLEGGLPMRVLSADDDLVTRPQPLPGERTVIKLRGDVLLGTPALTVARLAELPRRRPALFARLQGLAARGPVLFYGFGPRDATLRWLVEALAPLSGTAVLAARLGNVLWRAHWSDRGFEVVDAPTVPELETAVSRLCAQIDPRVELPDLDRVFGEVGALVDGALAPAPQLGWARRSPVELEALSGAEVDEVRAGLELLGALADRGLPIPPAAPALGAEVLQRQSDLPGARRAAALAVGAMRKAGRVDVVAAGAVGRVLNRMGDPDRARHYLELALQHGDAADRAARADELAWLSRCVLDRIDRLRARKRDRAVVELIAAFLQGQATHLALAQADPGDDEALRWSVYYINLRLGRVMGLASELADAAGEVYATQAVELLTRAIELAPFKPDAYKFIRPLLTDRRSGAADARRWMALVAGAPPQVQRRLGGR